MNRETLAFDLDLDREPTCPSDLVLDRFLAGELDGTAGRDLLAAHLEACPRCDHRRAELAGAAARFPEEVFVAGLAARSVRAARSRRPYALGGLAALAAAAAAAFFLVPGGGGLPGDGGTVRSKGGDSLAVFASRGGEVGRVLPGDPLSPGDAIRFEVAAPRRSWVVVLGIDAAGVVTPYAAGEGAGVPLDPGAPTLLPGSIVLDRTTGTERVVALFCERPVEAREAIRAGEAALARAGGDPAAPLELGVAGCRQASLPFRKVVR